MKHKIHTDDSAFQLVTVIIQKVKPIYFYSRKPNGAQERYTVTNKELKGNHRDTEGV